MSPRFPLAALGLALVAALAWWADGERGDAPVAPAAGGPAAAGAPGAEDADDADADLTGAPERHAVDAAAARAVARGAESATGAPAPTGAAPDGWLRVVATVRVDGALLRERDLDATLRFRSGPPGSSAGRWTGSGRPQLLATHEAVLTTDADGRVEWRVSLPENPDPERPVDVHLVLVCEAPLARGGHPRLPLAGRVVDGALDLGVLDLAPAAVVARGTVVDPDGRPIGGALVGPGSFDGDAWRSHDEFDARDPLTTRAGPDGRFELRTLAPRPPRDVVAHLPGYTGEPSAVPRGDAELTLVLWPSEPVRGTLVLPGRALPDADLAFQLEVIAVGVASDGAEVVVDRARAANSGDFELRGGVPLSGGRLRLGGSSVLAEDVWLEPAGFGPDASGARAGRFVLPADCTTCTVELREPDGDGIASFALHRPGVVALPAPGRRQLYVLRGEAWEGPVRYENFLSGHVSIRAPHTTATLEAAFHVELDVRLLDPELAGAEVVRAALLPADEAVTPSIVTYIERRDGAPIVRVEREGPWRVRVELQHPAPGGGVGRTNRTVGPLEFRRGASPVVVEL